MPRTLTLSDLIGSMTTFLRLSDAEFSRVVGASARTVERWRANETYPQHESRQRLDDLESLVQRLDATFKTPDGARLWLNTDSGYFGGLKPVEALLTGRIDAVDAALEALDSGVFV
jgi:Antitoxin Xre/MbcA/ParS C-terminal toxin-binding domain